MHIKHYLPWFVYALFMVLMGGYVLREQATNDRLVINTLIDKTLCKSDDLLDTAIETKTLGRWIRLKRRLW